MIKDLSLSSNESYQTLQLFDENGIIKNTASLLLNTDGQNVYFVKYEDISKNLYHILEKNSIKRDVQLISALVASNTSPIDIIKDQLVMVFSYSDSTIVSVTFNVS